MTGSLTPAAVLFLGALGIPFFKGRTRPAFMFGLVLLSFLHLLSFDHGLAGRVEIFNYTLTTVRVDKLALVFGYVFHIAALLAVIYALHLKDTLQQVTGLMYAGATIGGVFAGDLITLFIFWELTAVTSVFLIWARRSEQAYRAGMRYLIIQVGSGVILLAGVIVHVYETGSITFDHIGLESPGGLLMLIGIGIKCAFPLLHNWVQDTYPEATVTGILLLSSFTTKLAVYALARGFAGTEILLTIGCIMTIFPIFYAVLENDMRRVLSYSLNNQLGFMVAGVGVGTELAINGTAGHAFANIIFEGLLFMAMSAVLYRTGTIRASDLGGLYKTMPKTAGLCIVGSLSISAFPLFAGFVSKSPILTAVAEEGHWVAWVALLFASAGVIDHSGIKIPFFTFFAHDSGKRPQEAPRHMLVAMAVAAVLCVAIGVLPETFYALLPYETGFNPYTAPHLVNQVQLLFFAALAFAVLYRTGIYPPELPSRNIDSDWIYRKGLPILIGMAARTGRRVASICLVAGRRQADRFIARIYRHHGPQGILARTWPSGSTVLWVAVLLGSYLLLYYL